METFEELERALRTVSFDSEAIIGRAVARGRRIQRRRRVGVTAGVLALGTGVVLAQGAAPESSPHTIEPATDPSSTPTSQPGDGTGMPTPELTDARLVARLPVPGTLVEAKALGDDTVTVTRDIDPDGSGEGQVDVYLSRGPAMASDQLAGEEQKCALLAATPDGDNCDKVAGGWMFVYNMDKDPSQGSPRRFMWGATAVFQDGTSISVQATNYVGHDAQDRQTPVLDPKAVKDLTTDPVWFQPAS